MKLIENNRALKVLALVIAIVLWLYVGIEENPLSQRTYNVPVTVENLSADKVATISKERVNIKVMGRQTRLDAITSEDFKAYVDLSEAKIGEDEAEVKVSLPSEVFFAKLDPDTVNVHVTQREGETMDVEVVRMGMPQDGVTIEALNVEPQNVFVSGNEDALEMVAKVGVALDVSDIYESKKLDLSVQFYDYEGNVIRSEALKAYPEVVTLNVKAKSVAIQKAVPIRVDLVGSVPNGIQVDSVVVTPENAVVEGKPQALSKIDEVKTEAIDLSGVQETTSFTVALVGKYLQAGQTATVTINVSPQSESTVEGSVYTKVVPIAVTGSAAEQVSASTLMAEVTYHMQAGYSDAGDNLTAFVQINEVPEGSLQVNVQFNVVEGMVIDHVSPGTITLNPIY